MAIEGILREASDQERGCSLNKSNRLILHSGDKIKKGVFICLSMIGLCNLL